MSGDQHQYQNRRMIPDISYKKREGQKDQGEASGLYDDDPVKAALIIRVGRRAEGNSCAAVVVGQNTKRVGVLIPEVRNRLICPDDMRDKIFPSFYGWLKTEAGVHRLVRISPFDSNARRHTSFSSVTVYPVIDQSIEIDIPDKDVRIDVYRASGAGGQHVNNTESAVRITHLPTGIAVASQSERSQHQNRAICWEMLRSRLYEIELEKKKAETGAFVGEKSEIGWGHQIRSYVLQPYQLVKDLRTGVESRTPQDVLDGDLDPFMAAALAQEVGGKPREKIEDLA